MTDELPEGRRPAVGVLLELDVGHDEGGLEDDAALGAHRVAATRVVLDGGRAAARALCRGGRLHVLLDDEGGGCGCGRGGGGHGDVVVHLERTRIWFFVRFILGKRVFFSEAG